MTPIRLSQFRGDTATHTVALVDAAGAAFDPTGYNLLFTLKADLDDADVDALVQKTTGTGISVSGTSALVELVSADTESLALGTLLPFDIRATHTVTGARLTVALGTLKLNANATRETTPTVAINTTDPGAPYGDPTDAINAAAEKTTLADADRVPITDSEDSYSLKWWSWSRIKTALSSLFDPAGSAAAAQAAAAADATAKANSAQITAINTAAVDASEKADNVRALAQTDATEKADAAQAYAIQRANHTGTQAQSTVDGLVAALASKVDDGDALNSQPILVNGEVTAEWGKVYYVNAGSLSVPATNPASGESAVVYAHVSGSGLSVFGEVSEAGSLMVRRSYNNGAFVVSSTSVHQDDSAISVLADQVDFAGSTDIGADLADADEIIVSDGGGNTTRRKSALSRVWTYISGKLAGVYATLTGTETLSNKTLTNPSVNNYTEGVVAIGNSGTAQTISLTSGTVQTVTLTDNCTFTMPSATSGKSFILQLTQDGTGGRTAAFTGVEWAGGTAPTISTAASAVDILSFVCIGSTWYGTIGQNFS